MKIICQIIGMFFCCISMAGFAHAENVTAGLYLCPSDDGVTSVVNAQKAKTLSGCKPYNKTLLNGAQPQAITANNETNDKTHIFVCELDGKVEIIQSENPPFSFCSDMGITQSTSQRAPQSLHADSAQQALNTPLNADIYRCEENGIITYVPENQQQGYKNCAFYSHSLSSSRALLESNAKLQKQVTENSDTSGCVGAGEIRFNGVKRRYNCQKRSFDFTPGASEGSIQYGTKVTSIAAHSHNYFDESGSCGGTIRTPDGRILHLSPTKNCPTSVLNAAKAIANAYFKTINIIVNGAFLERQQKLAPEINRIAEKIGIDPYLIHAIISVESAYLPQAVSRAGATGLMQLMPATAARFGVQDSFHSGENIRGGATYLKWLINHFHGDLRLAIAGYNAGEGNVVKYGNKIPPFIETQAYVPKVLQFYQRYQENPALIGLSKK